STTAGVEFERNSDPGEAGDAAPPSLTNVTDNRVALRAGIPPFYVMDVWLAAAERQRSHGDLVNLSAGQPSAGAAAAVRAAAKHALSNTPRGDTVSSGTTQLRRAFAATYMTQHAPAPPTPTVGI